MNKLSIVWTFFSFFPSFPLLSFFLLLSNFFFQRSNWLLLFVYSYRAGKKGCKSIIYFTTFILYIYILKTIKLAACKPLRSPWPISSLLFNLSLCHSFCSFCSFFYSDICNHSWFSYFWIISYLEPVAQLCFWSCDIHHILWCMTFVMARDFP